MTHNARPGNCVEPCDPAAEGELQQFQRANFGVHSRQSKREYARWLFEANPNREPGQPVFWICRRDGVIVGQQGCVPVTLKVGSSAMRASWGVDLMVASAWRLKGIGPALSSEYEKSGSILMGLGMSSSAVRAYARAGWIDMGRLPLWVRPLDARACVHGLGKPWLAPLAPEFIVRGLSRLTACVLSAAMRCRLEPVERFDDRANSIWSGCEPDYPVIVKRDLAMLKWRFDQYPAPERYRRYYLMRGPRAVGYSVVRLDRWQTYSIARVVDVLAPRRYLSVLYALTIDAMREHRAAAVLIEQLLPSAPAVLRPLGCLSVAPVTQFMLKATPQAAVPSVLLHSAASWLVTRADSDADLASEAAIGIDAPAGTFSAPRAPESSNA